MQAISRLLSMATVAALAVGMAACSPDKDTIVEPIGGGNNPTFANVSAALVSACGSCHNVASGRTFIATMDSARLVASGLVNPASPGTSAILVKARSAAHGGGIVTAYSAGDIALATAWIAALPNIGAATLTSMRTEFAPTIDGIGEALWLQSQPLTVAIGGGWAAATSVAIRAMHDGNYLYMYLRWDDKGASYVRNPWLKNADGSWSVSPAKPAPTAGMDWAAYMASRGGASFNPEAPEFMYEDKLAIIWNTYGATTVPEFEQTGCAAACHDPAKGGSPGTTYNSVRPDLAAKKYLTVPGQILDMWHWKLVRQNMNSKIDDQHVRYWLPVNDATAGDGGRASDAGSPGYRSNPAVNGRPTYKSATLGYLPPIFSWAESDTLRMTDAEVAGLPAGTVVANMITSPPTANRADIDARGVYDRVARVWTMEIRRRLVTGDDKDVQFSDLTKTFKWGISVFDNAQIEHSYSGVPLSLVFKQ